ncbi:MAG: transcription antitermination factor NusB [Chlamydiota bacterium]
MAVPQQKIREIIFQLLFSYDMAEPHKQDMENLLMKELSVTRKTMRQAQEKVDHILSKILTIDQTIASLSESYDFSRIQLVEKNILRIGVYELLLDDTIPEKVAITEAMRLARKFSTKEAASFVNAVLDALMKRAEGNPDLAADELAQTFDIMIESEKASNEVLNATHKDEEKEDDAENSGEYPTQ